MFPSLALQVQMNQMGFLTGLELNQRVLSNELAVHV